MAARPLGREGCSLRARLVIPKEVATLVENQRRELGYLARDLEVLVAPLTKTPSTLVLWAVQAESGNWKMRRTDRIRT